MASKPKPSRTRSTASRRRKPATIDLKAKEVQEEESSKVKDSSSSGDKKPASKAADPKPAATRTERPTGQSSKDTGAASGNFGRSSTSRESDKPTEIFDKPLGALPDLPKLPGGSILAAIVGGLVVLVLLSIAGQFQFTRNLPVFGSIFGGGTNVEFESRLNARIQTLEERLANSGSGTDSGALQALADRLESAEKTIAELSVPGDSSVNETRLADLEQQISGVSNMVGQLQASVQELPAANVVDIDVQGFEERLGSIEERISNLASGKTDSDMAGRLEGVEAALSSLMERPVADLTVIEGRLTEAENLLGQLASLARENAESLSGLAGKSEVLESQLAAAEASERVARSVAVNSLGAALRNGNAIGISLSSLEALTGPTKETRRLAELDQLGVASLQTLVEGFEAFSRSIEGSDEEAGDTGLVNRFLANARKLYTIRPSGPIEGDEPAAVMSRIRSHLEKDELTAVLSEWENLPPSAKNEGEPWIGQVANRAEAFSLYENLSAALSSGSAQQ